MSDITTTQPAKRTLRFYSKEEITALKPFIKGDIRVSQQNLAEFCKKYNRTFLSVQMFVYNTRRKNQATKVLTNPNVSLKKDDSPAKLSKGEFKIPVNNWTMTNEDGKLYLVVKF